MRASARVTPEAAAIELLRIGLHVTPIAARARLAARLRRDQQRPGALTKSGYCNVRCRSATISRCSAARERTKNRSE
jgi:hypothetical protein